MKNYIGYKNQINGLQDVLQTVKTTEKIAASSVHLLKTDVNYLGIYSKHIQNTLTRLSLYHKNQKHPLLSENNHSPKALLILTGDKGLVGGLWHNLISSFIKGDAVYHSIIIYGAKGKNYLTEEKAADKKSFNILNKNAEEIKIEDLIDYVFETFKKEKFSTMDILYPEFISLAVQEPRFVSFLPFKFELENKIATENSIGLPIFESSKEKIFDELLQKYTEVFLRKIILETKLSELSARTVSMEHATAKTEGFIKQAELSFVKERRRLFTQRQLESFTSHKTHAIEKT